jgi:hypothetical protein
VRNLAVTPGAASAPLAIWRAMVSVLPERL